MLCCSSKEESNQWAFPTHILGSIHWKTKVTLAWASHSSRMHETDFKRTYFKIFMFLLRAWGEITNIYNNPWQQETWLTTTQFRLNPWSANELQLWVGGGSKNVKRSHLPNCRQDGKDERSRDPTWNRWVLLRTGQNVMQFSTSPCLKGSLGVYSCWPHGGLRCVCPRFGW